MNAPMKSREAAQCIEEMRDRLADRRRESNSASTVCKWCAAILVLLVLALLSGCAAMEKGNETSAVRHSLSTVTENNNAALSDLSMADGKAAVIQEWFRQRRAK